MLGKLDSHRQKSKTGTLSYTMHKNQLKMDERLTCSSWSHKNVRRKYKEKFIDIHLGKYLLSMTTKAHESKKSRQMGLPYTKMFN